MENSVKTAVVEAIEQTMQRTGKSQNALAKDLEISPSTLSDIRNKNWTRISDEMWNKLQGRLKLDSWRIIETPNLVRINNLCEDAQNNQRFLAVAEFTGAGKTTAFRYYCNTRSNACYMLANALMRPQDLVDAIMKAINIEAAGTQLHKVNAICNKLNSMEKPLLVIDDFGKLSDNCYRILQIIYDNTERHCGIVIGGTERLKNYILSMAKKDKLGFRELKRRVAGWQTLVRPTKKEIASLCQLHGITDNAFVAQICQQADDYGTIRELIQNELRLRNKGSIAANSFTDQESQNA